MSNQPVALVGADNQHSLIRPDPDSPHWGLLGGVCIWVLSVVLPQVLPLPFLFIDQASGRMPSPEQIAAGNIGARLVIVSVIATAVGHIVILATCWAVVTQFGRRPFFATLGWNFGGLHPGLMILLVVGAIASIYIITTLLQFVLPQSEDTLFSKMLKASDVGRYMIAALAVMTAPFVEELVYRGMLYSGLKSRIPAPPAVLIVGLIFTLVHLQQYWGAWVSLIGLTLLSFILTAVRAYTKSILPCVIIHLIFNIIGATSILLGNY